MPFPFLVSLLPLDVTPEKTVQSFVAAINAHRADAARQVMGGRSAAFPKGISVPTLRARVGRATVTGDRAHVSVDLSFEGGAGQETVDLQRIGGDWKIVPVDPRAFGANPLKYVGILAYSTVHPEIMTMAKPAAKKTQCLSNVKQLALATILYAVDHNDVLPKTSARWKAAIMPYTNNGKIFHCPEDASGGDSYFLDPRVAGMSMTQIALPAETAMIVEGTSSRAAFRHSGIAALGYVDGHAKLVKPTVMVKARTVKLR